MWGKSSHGTGIVWQRRLPRFLARRLRAVGVVAVVLSCLLSGAVRLTLASAVSVPPGNCNDVLLAGSSWLGGGGVNVESNGPDQGGVKSCGGTSVVNGITAGSEWQCVELVNRLYISKGWIKTTWHGFGGRSAPSTLDSMYDEAPAGLLKSPNGSITSVSPGDVVSINEYHNGTFLPDGHVLIVNTTGTVTSGSVPLVSQNGGNSTSALTTRLATLSGGTLTLPSAGSYSYPVIGVVHAPAQPTHSWSISPSPNPTGATGTYLSGVSCPSTTVCFAVGEYITAFKTVVERWNGTGWSIVTSPNAFDGGNLLAVSCPSTTSCFAVGYTVSHPVTTSLVEHWNGTSWSIMTSPNPGSGGDILYGVSCPSTTSCFAVGYSNSFNGLVEHWNGTSWSTVTSPTPTGSIGAILNGVSCPSTTSCFAVGDYLTHTVTKSLVEHWNGTSWSIMTSPSPGSAVTDLDGVSCPSTTSCFAVGVSSGPANALLVEHWNGTNWSIMTSPIPTGSTNTRLLGVSCPSTTNCFAVGDYNANTVSSHLVEHWNGTSWSLSPSPSPSPSPTGSVLDGVSCASTTSCFAVGDYGTVKSLIERYA